MNFIIYVFVTTFIFGNTFVAGISFQEDVAVTVEQKKLIDKLRQRVLPHIVENYMKQDLHLAKFLRSTNFDLDRAEKKILEDIRWRNETKMATIEEIDLSDINSDFPFLRGGHDKDGRPFVIALASEWNLRSAVVTGNSKRLVRYMERELEMTARKVRQLQSEGKNVTQAILIADLNHWSAASHLCMQCFGMALNFMISVENHFPGLADKIIFLNASPALEFAMDFIRQHVSKETRKALRVYGTNKQQWKKLLLQWIDRKYLPVDLGGTLERE